MAVENKTTLVESIHWQNLLGFYLLGFYFRLLELFRFHSLISLSKAHLRVTSYQSVIVQSVLVSPSKCKSNSNNSEVQGLEFFVARESQVKGIKIVEEQQKIPDLQPRELKAISEQQHSYFVGMCVVLFKYFLFCFTL